jgi:Tol biopolymer transport system component
MAFSWISDGQMPSHIYVQRIGDTALTPLTSGSQADYHPVWSPDGRQIAFIRYLNSGLFEVLRISLASHSETAVGQFSFDGLQFYEQPGLDWSPDGKSLLVADKPSRTAPARLVVVDLATENRRSLTSPPRGSTGDLEGKFSPDGKLVAFHRGGLGDLYVVSASGEDSSAARRLTPDNPGVHGIAWSRDGRQILFGSMEGGHGWGIWQESVDGGAPAPVLAGSLDVNWPAVSPDGRHLAVEQQDVVTNLTAISLHTDGAEHSFAPSSRNDFSPVYSPDGKQVVFASTRSGSIELWLANFDGSTRRQVTWLNGSGFPLTPSWSADGKKIIFAIRRWGATNLAVVRIADGVVTHLTKTPDRNVSPVFDADGKFIYYDSNADGMERIWRIAADGSGRAEEMFWDAPWTFFAFSSPARSIYFQTPGDGIEVDARDLNTGVQREVFRSHDWLAAPGNLCMDARKLYSFVSRKSDPSHQKLISIDIASGRTALLKNIDPAVPQMYTGCSVSPDGNTLLVPTVERFDSDIYMAALGK